MRRPLVLAICLAAPSALLAQGKPPKTEPPAYAMAKEYRTVQASALQAQRKLLLSFADSMPERHYRDKATPEQRDFAQQVHHMARAAGFVGSLLQTGAPRVQSADDSVKAIGSRVALKAYIAQEFDFLDGLLKSQSDSDRDTRVQFFNGVMIPRWQVWDELNQHTWWTAGQVVANFRKLGMAPPNFIFF
ncbi:MAG: DinB family protein [Gemmatimonadales bacterium]